MSTMSQPNEQQVESASPSTPRRPYRRPAVESYPLFERQALDCPIICEPGPMGDEICERAPGS